MEYTDEQIEGIKFQTAIKFLAYGIALGITICFVFSTLTGFSSLQYTECTANLQGCIDAFNNAYGSQLSVMKGLPFGNNTNYSLIGQ